MSTSVDHESNEYEPMLANLATTIRQYSTHIKKTNEVFLQSHHFIHTFPFVKILVFMAHDQCDGVHVMCSKLCIFARIEQRVEIIKVHKPDFHKTWFRVLKNRDLTKLVWFRLRLLREK